MNILMITENDPAGMGIAFTNALNRYTEHSCRLITTTTRYNFEFEKDIHLPDLEDDGFDEIHELLQKADILHFHILADEHIELGPIKVQDYIGSKAIIHHHHGHPDFRAHPEKYRTKYQRLRRKAIVSTPDLLKLLPEASWQPNLVPINDPLYLPFSDTSDGKIRVCHSPTRKDLKNTSDFDAVMENLTARYKNLEKVVIENTRHTDCLKMKQSCDIHFDHMQGYFGVASLEGLSQGKPVIAGLDDWNMTAIREFSGCDKIPWVLAHTQDELKRRLSDLAVDTDLRKETGINSRQFMEDHWNELAVLSRLLDVYGGR